MLKKIYKKSELLSTITEQRLKYELKLNDYKNKKYRTKEVQRYKNYIEKITKLFNVVRKTKTNFDVIFVIKKTDITANQFWRLYKKPAPNSKFFEKFMQEFV